MDEDCARLTTGSDAASAYRDAVLCLPEDPHGAVAHAARALALDPTFALAHAALAVLGTALACPVSVHDRIAAAQLHARCSSAYERSHVDALLCLLRGNGSRVAEHELRYPIDLWFALIAAPLRERRISRV